jgi:Flp pilus assembly protein TadG
MSSALRAQALVWLTVTLPIFVAMAGLSIDGALLLMTRRQLQSAVDGAARAGATQLDQELLRGSAGGHVQLDTAAARKATLEYLGNHLGRELPWATAPRAEVKVTQQRVHVAVQGVVHTAFLRVVQVERVPVGATAFADVQFGIRGPGGR